jgi:hypothetical protein
MISVLASSTVDRGFEPRSGQTTDYKIGATCLPAANSTIFQRCHGENKLIFNDEVRFVLDQHAELDLYSG